MLWIARQHPEHRTVGVHQIHAKGNDVNTIYHIAVSKSIMTTKFQAAGSPLFEWCDACQDWHATGKCPRQMMLRVWAGCNG